MKSLQRFIAFLTLVCFTATFIIAEPLQALAAPSAAPAPAGDLLALAPNAGRIAGAADYGSSTVVIALQDLHCHAEVQRNIAALLGALDRQLGLATVYVEGAAGPVDTSWLSGINDPSLRSEIATGMLEQGTLTGTEYYAILSGKPRLLQGLEDGPVYRDNFARLTEIIGRQAGIAARLAVIERELDVLAAANFTPAQRRFDGAVRAYRKGEMAPEKFYRLLQRFRSEGRVLEPAAPGGEIEAYLSLLQAGRKLRLRRVNEELLALTGELKSRLPYTQYRRLVNETGNFSRLSALPAALAAFEGGGRSFRERYPRLDDYFAYLRRSRELNPLRLSRAEALEIGAVREGLAASREEREIAFLADFLPRFEDYLTARLSSDDYGYFRSELPRFCALWSKYSDTDIAALFRGDLSLLDDYYRVNDERTALFLRRLTGIAVTELPARAPRFLESGDGETQALLRSLHSAKEIRVVVTGGFHTEGLARLLDERRISHLVITPNVTLDTGHSEAAYRTLARHQAAFLTQAFALCLFSQMDRTAEMTGIVQAELGALLKGKGPVTRGLLDAALRSLCDDWNGNGSLAAGLRRNAQWQQYFAGARVSLRYAYLGRERDGSHRVEFVVTRTDEATGRAGDTAVQFLCAADGAVTYAEPKRVPPKAEPEQEAKPPAVGRAVLKAVGGIFLQAFVIALTGLGVLTMFYQFPSLSQMLTFFFSAMVPGSALLLTLSGFRGELRKVPGYFLWWGRTLKKLVTEPWEGRLLRQFRQLDRTGDIDDAALKVYESASFSALLDASHAGWAPAQNPVSRYSLALAVSRLIDRFGRERSEAAIAAAAGIVVPLARERAGRVLVDGNTHVLTVHHAQAMFEEGLVRDVLARCGALDCTSVKASEELTRKEDVLGLIAGLPRDRDNLVWFDGHGNREELSLTGTADASLSAITVNEMAEAVISARENGADPSRLTILLDCCYSYDYAVRLLNTLARKGETVLPLVITVANKDKRAQKNYFLKAVAQSLRPGSPLLLGDIMQAERYLRRQDVALFFPVSKQKLAEVHGAMEALPVSRHYREIEEQLRADQPGVALSVFDLREKYFEDILSMRSRSVEGFIGKLFDADGNLAVTGARRAIGRGQVFFIDAQGGPLFTESELALPPEERGPARVRCLGPAGDLDLAALLGFDEGTWKKAELLMPGFRRYVQSLSSADVQLLEDNGAIRGFHDGERLFIERSLLADRVALFHELGHGYFARYPQYLPAGINAHTYLRGLGKDARLLLAQVSPTAGVEGTIAFLREELAKISIARPNDAEFNLIRHFGGKGVQDELFGDDNRLSDVEQGTAPRGSIFGKEKPFVLAAPFWEWIYALPGSSFYVNSAPVRLLVSGLFSMSRKGQPANLAQKDNKVWVLMYQRIGGGRLWRFIDAAVSLGAAALWIAGLVSGANTVIETAALVYAIGKGAVFARAHTWTETLGERFFLALLGGIFAFVTVAPVHLFGVVPAIAAGNGIATTILASFIGGAAGLAFGIGFNITLHALYNEFIAPLLDLPASTGTYRLPGAEGEAVLRTLGLKPNADILEIYKRIEELGDPLSDGEHEFLFDLLWKRSGSSHAFPLSLKRKLLRDRKAFGPVDMLMLFGGFNDHWNIALINTFKARLQLSTEEERFLWQLFSERMPEFTNRGFGEIDAERVAAIDAAVGAALASRGKADLLEVGCGREGKVVRAFKERYGAPVNASGIDLNVAEASGEGLRLVRGSAKEMGPFFPDESFDVAYEHEVIIYFTTRPELSAFLSEVMRVLRPGGKFVVTSSYRDVDLLRSVLRQLGVTATVTEGAVLTVTKEAAAPHPRQEVSRAREIIAAEAGDPDIVPLSLERAVGGALFSALKAGKTVELDLSDVDNYRQLYAWYRDLADILDERFCSAAHIGYGRSEAYECIFELLERAGLQGNGLDLSLPLFLRLDAKTGTLTIYASANRAAGKEERAEAVKARYISGYRRNRIAEAAKAGIPLPDGKKLSVSEKAGPELWQATLSAAGQPALVTWQGMSNEEAGSTIAAALRSMGLSAPTQEERRALLLEAQRSGALGDRLSVIEGIPFIAVDGLLKGTGSFAHVGLGQSYGTPVVYIDGRYSRHRTVIAHELMEIALWQAAFANELRGVARLADVREWMRAHPDEAARIARGIHAAANRKADITSLAKREGIEPRTCVLEEGATPSIAAAPDRGKKGPFAWFAPVTGLSSSLLLQSPLARRIAGMLTRPRGLYVVSTDENFTAEQAGALSAAGLSAAGITFVADAQGMKRLQRNITVSLPGGQVTLHVYKGRRMTAHGPAELLALVPAEPVDEAQAKALLAAAAAELLRSAGEKGSLLNKVLGVREGAPAAVIGDDELLVSRVEGLGADPYFAGTLLCRAADGEVEGTGADLVLPAGAPVPGVVALLGTELREKTADAVSRGCGIVISVKPADLAKPSFLTPLRDGRIDTVLVEGADTANRETLARFSSAAAAKKIRLYVGLSLAGTDDGALRALREKLAALRAAGIAPAGMKIDLSAAEPSSVDPRGLAALRAALPAKMPVMVLLPQGAGDAAREAAKEAGFEVVLRMASGEERITAQANECVELGDELIARGRWGSLKAPERLRRIVRNIVAYRLIVPAGIVDDPEGLAVVRGRAAGSEGLAERERAFALALEDGDLPDADNGAALQKTVNALAACVTDPAAALPEREIEELRQQLAARPVLLDRIDGIRAGGREPRQVAACLQALLEGALERMGERALRNAGKAVNLEAVTAILTAA